MAVPIGVLKCEICAPQIVSSRGGAEVTNVNAEALRSQVWMDVVVVKPFDGDDGEGALGNKAIMVMECDVGLVVVMAGGVGLKVTHVEKHEVADVDPVT